jgi:hypothetical protein
VVAVLLFTTQSLDCQSRGQSQQKRRRRFRGDVTFCS